VGCDLKQQKILGVGLVSRLAIIVRGCGEISKWSDEEGVCVCVCVSGYLPIPGKDESGEGDGVMMSTPLSCVCLCV
jgi:hypothetical protein